MYEIIYSLVSMVIFLVGGPFTNFDTLKDLFYLKFDNVTQREGEVRKKGYLINHLSNLLLVRIRYILFMH